MPIFLPPLRSRREDLALLIEHFLERFCRSSGRTVRSSAEAMRCLMSYAWPDNIRELENTIQRLVVLAEDEEMRAGDLTLHS